MAQNPISINLSAADFTLSYSFKGPSVVIPGNDQNFFGSTGAWSGDTPQKGVNIPQLYYCENTVPTAEGYRSIVYRYHISPPAGPQRFVKVLSIFDGGANSALIGYTADLKLYIVSSYTDYEWQELALPAGFTWDSPSLVTTTTIIGFVVLCVQGSGIFAVDIASSTLSEVIWTGIDQTEIIGVCASHSILIVWDATDVYWSSTTDPRDFTPSLTTGAGRAQPDGLKGSIILCKEIKGGFIVYSEVTLIGAEYTQVNAIPWLFTTLAGGAGIKSADMVAYDINLSAHFVWTSAGLMSVQVNQVELLFPQITDFIASGLTDVTTSYTSYPSLEFDGRPKEIRLGIIASRYLCISFGYLSEQIEDELQIPEMHQSFIYDSKLRRWGKLNIEHIQILESPLVAEPPVFF